MIRYSAYVQFCTAFIHGKNHSLSILCQEWCNDAMNKAFHIFDLFSNAISHRVHHCIHVKYSTFIRFHFFQISNSQSAHFQWRQTKLIFVSAEHYIIHSQSQSQLHTNIHSLVHRFILCGLFSFFFLCVCLVMLHTSVVVVAADDFNGFMRYINIHLKRAWEEKAADERKKN